MSSFRLICLSLALSLPAVAHAQSPCDLPQPLCAAREGVFKIEAYDPAASAVRIGPDLLVTNRHVVADERTVRIVLGDGTAVAGQVVPTIYGGDLILVRAGLPEGPALAFDDDGDGGPYRAVGYDLSSATIEVYDSGALLVGPQAGAFARVQHLAPTAAGNSGGALIDEEGELVAINASGGEGRSEAIPVAAIADLQAQSGEQFAEQSARIGEAYRRCDERLGEARRMRGALPGDLADELESQCLASANPVLIQLAAQAFGERRELERSSSLFITALAADPNNINLNLGYATTMHLEGKFTEGARILGPLLDRVPQDATIQRLALQAGKWGDAPALAEQALELIAQYNPAQAEAARRFYEADMPPPGRVPRVQ